MAEVIDAPSIIVPKKVDIERPGFMGADDYLNFPRAEQPWIIKDVLPIGGKLLLFSAPKVGKSYLALQLSEAIAEGGEFMHFPILQTGRVMYMQLDTPGSTWLKRVRLLRNHGFKLDQNKVFFADNSTLPIFPFDFAQPGHVEYMMKQVQGIQPLLVIIDTLRKAHTGDENSSTAMSNIMSHIQKAIYPAALMIISHDKKPQPDQEKDIMMDHRGSTAVTGEVDTVLRMLKTRLYFKGRDLEQDSIRLVKHVIEEGEEHAIFWEPDPSENEGEILRVLHDQTLPTMRSKARALALALDKSDEAAMSRLRRYVKKNGGLVPLE